MFLFPVLPSTHQLELDQRRKPVDETSLVEALSEKQAVAAPFFKPNFLYSAVKGIQNDVFFYQSPLSELSCA